MVVTPAPRAAVRRLVVALLAVVLTAAGVSVSGVLSATGSSFPPATPQAHCGPGARPETAIQGRVPQRDYDSGRVRRGYRCNTVPVAHHGRTGGFKVLRYTDARGHTCAFYDSTLLFPKDVAQNVLANSGRGIGVVVLDMDDPAHAPPDREPDHAGDAHPARVRAAQREARAARRGLGQPGHGAGRPGPVRRAHRLPAPEAALLDTQRACSATRAAGRATAGRSTPPAPAARPWSRSTSATRPCRSRSSPRWA